MTIRTSTDKPIIVVYHIVSKSLNCDDGFAAAFAAWLKFKEGAEYIGATYSTNIPLSMFVDKTVYFVDFCFGLETMDAIAQVADSLVVLDHHKTSFEAVGHRPYAKLSNSKSGAVLSWNYFHPDTPVPTIFEHIQDNDLWLHKDPHTKAFIERLKTMPYTFESWHTFLSKFTHNNKMPSDAYRTFIKEGMILEEQAQVRSEQLASEAVPISLLGKHGLAVCANKFFANSVCEILAQKSGTFGASYFIRADGKVEVSLRSVKGVFDVECIAKQFGNGGGHSSAAAFAIPLSDFAAILQPTSDIAKLSYLRTELEKHLKDLRQRVELGFKSDLDELTHEFCLNTASRFHSPESPITIKLASKTETWADAYGSLLKGTTARIFSLVLPRYSEHATWYTKLFSYTFTEVAEVDTPSIEGWLNTVKESNSETYLAVRESALLGLIGSVRAVKGFWFTKPKTMYTLNLKFDGLIVEESIRL